MPRHLRSRTSALPGALVALVIAGACSSAPSTTPTSAPTVTSGVTPSPPASSGAAQAVPAVLDFTAPQLGGGTVEGADYAGKDTAIWFWAPW